MISPSNLSVVNSEAQTGATIPGDDPSLNSDNQDIQDLESTPRSVPSISEYIFRPTSSSPEDSSDSESNISPNYAYRLKKSIECKDNSKSTGRAYSFTTESQQNFQSIGRHTMFSHPVSNASQKPRANRSLSEAYVTSNNSKFTIKGPSSYNILPSSAVNSSNTAVRPRTAPYHSNTFSSAGSIEAFSAQMNKMSLKDEALEVGQPKTM